MDLMPRPRRVLQQLLLGALLVLGGVVRAAAPAVPDKQQALWDHLRARIGEVEQHLDGVLGVAITDLSTGQQFLLRPDEVFPQASSIKLLGAGRSP